MMSPAIVPSIRPSWLLHAEEKSIARHELPHRLSAHHLRKPLGPACMVSVVHARPFALTLGPCSLATPRGRGQRMRMPDLIHRPVTVDDYVRLEASSELRHEYVGGEMYAMAG